MACLLRRSNVHASRTEEFFWLQHETLNPVNRWLRAPRPPPAAMHRTDFRQTTLAANSVDTAALLGPQFCLPRGAVTVHTLPGSSLRFNSPSEGHFSMPIHRIHTLASPCRAPTLREGWRAPRRPVSTRAFFIKVDPVQSGTSPMSVGF